jgi:hypothetical protein
MTTFVLVCGTGPFFGAVFFNDHATAFWIDAA